MKTVMQQLETISAKYQKKIDEHAYTHVYPEPGWQEDAMAKTVSEVPFAPLVGTEVGALPESPAAAQRCKGERFPCSSFAWRATQN